MSGADPTITALIEALKSGAADDLMHAGRIIERYEEPILQPLSEANFRTYESARRTFDRLEHLFANAMPAIVDLVKIHEILIGGDDPVLRLHAQAKEIERLRAELATAQKDAERYRWIGKHAVVETWGTGRRPLVKLQFDAYADSMDDVIDERMAALAQQKGKEKRK